MKYYPSPEENIDRKALIEVLKTAFMDHGMGRCEMPPKSYVSLPGGDFRTMPSYLPSLKIAGVKVVNVHPENKKFNIPTVMSTTVLLDPDTGRPVAILNSTDLTALRTGVSAAVATMVLSSAKKGTLGIIGAGKQAESGLLSILEVYDPMEIKIWSRHENTAKKFIETFHDHDISYESIEKTSDSDLLLTVTPSIKPLVQNDWIHEGTHINAMGADAPGKQELDPEILNHALVFVDDREQAVHSGEINVPLKNGLFSPEKIAGTLGEVLIGKVGRTSNDEVTIFDSTGIAITDLAIASLALNYAKYVELP